jgi:hypothetical protein
MFQPRQSQADNHLASAHPGLALVCSILSRTHCDIRSGFLQFLFLPRPRASLSAFRRSRFAANAFRNAGKDPDEWLWGDEPMTGSGLDASSRCPAIERAQPAVTRRGTSGTALHCLTKAAGSTMPCNRCLQHAVRPGFRESQE